MSFNTYVIFVSLRHLSVEDNIVDISGFLDVVFNCLLL